MARPAKAAEESRTERLPDLRVTPAERAFVEAQAMRARARSVSDYCRAAILRQQVRARLTAPTDALLVELNRIGVNLNQIAKGFNGGRGLPPDFPHVLARLDRALAKVLADGA